MMTQTTARGATTAEPLSDNPAATTGPATIDQPFTDVVDKVKGMQNDYRKGMGSLQVEHAGKMDDLVENHMNKLSGIRLGHEAMMLQDAQKVLVEARDNPNHKDIMNGGSALTETPGAVAVANTPSGILADLGDMINVGNISIEQPRPDNPAPPNVIVPSPINQPPNIVKAGVAGLGKLAKVGVAAALLGSGGGAAIGIPLAYNAMFGDKPPSVITPTPNDKDTYYELGLHPKGNDATE